MRHYTDGGKRCRFAYFLASCALVAAGGLTTEGALAQGGAPVADAPAIASDDIVVTARKRAESLQDVPISISAFSGQDLEDRQVGSIDRIAAFTPNLSFNPSASVSGSNSAAAIFIRGIGQGDFSLNADPGVGVYVDGVFYARSIGSVIDALDLERVEVLRGPQGTLFGRNTIGGAINLTTQRPGTSFGGKVEAATGTDNLVRLRGSVDLPLGEGLLTRISAMYANQDGYVRKVLTGDRLGDTNSFNIRGRLVATLSDNVELDISADYARERENGAPLTLVDNNENGSFPAFHNAGVGAPCFPAPGSLQDPRCYNGQWLPSNPFVTYATGRTKSDLDAFGISGTLSVDLGDYLIKAITAYRKIDAQFGRDEDHSPIMIAETFNSPFKHRQFSQEIQFNGSAFDDALSWVTGLYYFEESGRDNDNVTFNLVALQSGGRIDNKSYAAFGEFDYRLAPGLTATLGLRYSKDIKRWAPDQFVKTSAIGIPSGTLVQPLTVARISTGEATPHAVLKYEAASNFTTYVSYARGFKSGGFSQRIFPPRPDIPSFQPEYATVYEGGLKFHTLDNVFRLNAALFHTDYKDMQVFVSPPGTPGTITANAARATIDGAEVELFLRPTPGLTLQGGIGYLDAGYKTLGAFVIGITPDSRLPYTPEWALNAALSYEHDAWSAGSLNARIDWSYTSATYTDAANTAALRQAGYHVVNANIAFRPAGSTVELYAAVQNLFDQTYFTGGYADLNDLGIAEAAFARPRNWTVGVKMQF
ncbi:TonB-dependent receptor [Sphingomonas flavalba]|uniref:TonB-dependent receptor n=1 Tax=Sphingomonas flavalba TaxID=2559804 RepID=UPI00109E0936|nr:TonB-dependent receptor [Sphingomonas flavalba]